MLIQLLIIKHLAAIAAVIKPVPVELDLIDLFYIIEAKMKTKWEENAASHIGANDHCDFMSAFYISN